MNDLTYEQKKAYLQDAIERKKKTSSHNTDVADWGEIVDGFFRSGSKKPFDVSFYDRMRQRGTDSVEMAKEDKKQAIADHILGRNMKRQEEQDAYSKSRDEIADQRYADSLDYGKGRDTIKDDQWEKQFNKKTSLKGADKPFELKIDGMGRAIVFDKRDGTIKNASEARELIQSGQVEDKRSDGPMQPRPGESKPEFNARVKEKYQKEKAPTETQAKALSQHHRLKDAERLFSKVGDTISEDSWNKLEQQVAQDRLWDTTAGQLIEGLTPIKRDKDSDILSSDEQQILQGQRQWSEAFVRSTSGAVIGERELTDEEVGQKSAAAMKIFFPQRGDSPAVIERKRAARKNAMESVQMKTGKLPDTTKVINGIKYQKVDGGWKRIN